MANPSPPTVTVIIPVRNGGPAFKRCLAALNQSSARPFEVLVADDGSTDSSAQWAVEAGARLVRPEPLGGGPAAARNAAAARASGDVLFFFDSDVQVRPDTVARVERAFADDPALAALFGSYDDSPGDPGFLSQFKNLFHHYVHQHGAEEASTFWSGCGAVRRDAFLAVGGFPARYRLPSIEDIELGYLLKRRGHRLRLDKGLQVKHLKRWTLPGLLHSDIVARGIPWTRLILREGAFLNDLNLQTHNRFSVVAAYLGVVCALAGVWIPAAWLGVPLAALTLLALNWPLYRWFARKRGAAFAAKTLAPHWLYYFYNGISFGAGALLHLRDQIAHSAAESPRHQDTKDTPFSLRASASLWLMVAILLVATLLRFHRLGAQSMWLDELLEIGIARQPYAAILSQLLAYGAMPLDYFVAHGALLLGDQDFWLRAVPALFSVMTVAAMYRLAGRLVNRATGLAAGALLAVGAFHVHYAQETRPYALFGLLALLSFHFLFRALKTNQPAHWIGYAAATALSLATHYFTLFMIAAQMLIVLQKSLFSISGADRAGLRDRLGLNRQRWLRFALALSFVGVVLSLTPYLDNVLEVGSEFTRAMLGLRANAAAIQPAADPLLQPPILNREFFVGQLLGELSGGGGLWPWLFLALAMAGAIVGWRRHGRVLAALAIWAVAPILLTVIFLIHRQTFFAVRYVTPAYVALIILVAVGVVEIAGLFKERLRAVALLGLLGVSVAFSLLRVNAYYATNKENWRGAGHFIDANYSPGDKVDSPLGGGVIFHYTRLADAGRLDTTSTADLDSVTGRLWVVMHPYIGPATGGLGNWLAAQPSAVEYRIDEGLRVFVLDKSKTRAEILASITPPDTPTAWSRLGEQYALIGAWAEAETSYLRAIASSDAPQFKVSYADTLRQNGQTDRAARYYLAALMDEPQAVGALNGIGRIYLERRLFDEALTAFTRAAAADPGDYTANFFLAQTYDRLGRPAEAAPYRDRASQIVPDLIEPP